MEVVPEEVVNPMFTYVRQEKTVCNQPECDWETVFFDTLHNQTPTDMAKEHMTDAHGVLYDDDAVAKIQQDAPSTWSDGS
jgi:predicted ATP-dependent Lon-type protease